MDQLEPPTRSSSNSAGPAASSGSASGAVSSAAPKRQRYPSDLSDAQWKRIEPLVARKAGRGRKPEVSLREIVNAMHYRWTTNCAWRMLPHDFPAWNTVYFYYRTWREKNILTELRIMLIERPTVMDITRQQIAESRDARRAS